MRVQLLSFPGCPNVEATREAVRQALIASGLPPRFEEVDVTAAATPDSLKAWGSPTVLIEGRDIAGEEPTGPCCRLYDSDGPRRGVPPDAMILEAIREAADGRSQRRPGPQPAAIGRPE